MFTKKKCPRCGRKIEKEYDFCPYCGNDFRYEKKNQENRNFGMLGKEDSLTGFSESPNFPATDISGLFNSKLFNNLFQEFDKQFHGFDRELAKKPKTDNKNIRKSGISINISMSNGKNPDIKISGFGPDLKNLKQETREKRIHKSEISDEEAKKLAKLPRKEAETSVRRFSNKVVYEVAVPGIKNLKDIIINKLENSIEIKAFSKENAYFKLIPVNLPILNYKLDKEKLILELGTR
jgi:hypothetical protein